MLIRSTKNLNIRNRSIPYVYVKAANQLVAEHNCLIQPFLKQMYTFYGTAPSSWQKIIVHPCRVSVGTTYLFYNRVFLAIESMNNLRSDLGTVIHETAHAIYERQERTLQYAMEKFFLHYPSPYAPLAYRYLNEALATALGNGMFMKRLTGHTGITYNNLYIQGFA